MTILTALVFYFGLAYSDSWVWPVDTTHGLTASFGEYRGARFHMGVDFSTGGVEGEPIRAALPGRVFRVRSGSRGFGKVIYIRHPGERVTVYAHLAKFGPRLSKALEEMGLDPEGTFNNQDPGLEVNSEEVLAWSGESGAGLPHLHFEVRDGNNRPLDPLTLPFPPLQSLDQPARIQFLRLVPLDGEARINGRQGPVEIPPGAPVLQAQGRIGVLVSAHAPGPRSSRLGLRGIRVYQDDRLLGSWLPRNLNFAYNGNAGLVHDQVRSGFGPTTFLYSFDNRQAYLPAITGYRQEGVLSVKAPSILRVEVMNMAAGWQAYSWRLDPEAGLQSGRALPDIPIQATSLDLRLWGKYVLAGSPKLGGTLQTPDTVKGLAAGEEYFWEVDHGDQRPIFWRTPAGNLSRNLGRLEPAANFDLTLGSWRLRARNARPLPEQAMVLEPADPKIAHQALDYVSPVLRFGFEGLPVTGISLSYRDSEATNLGIYAWSYSRQRWRHQGRLENEGSQVELNHLAPVVVARDISPPVVLRPRYHQYFTGRRVVIRVRDLGSGIAGDSLKVSGPTGEVRAEWDPDRGWIVLPKSATRGPWRVSIADRSGNRVTSNNLRL